jgi:RNA polymerase sigma factor (sigma-70 family)
MDDASLLQATATGDADAFAVFYRRHLALVVGFAARMTRDRDAAADLTGEVFAAALAGCGRYRPTHVSAAPWLIGIAQNKLRESQRRGRVQDAVRRRLQMRPIELGEDDLERVEALASASYSDVLAAVEALPRDERNAVRARIVEERDYRELAERLRCSESVVRQRVSRALRRIREQVSEPVEESET